MAKNDSLKRNKGSSGQNRKASDDQLSKFRVKPDVIETESGLLYRVLELGDGITPCESDSVTVHQRIKVVNGKVIADTYRIGVPDTFTLKEAIPGVRELMLLAHVGGRYECMVPPELAWGKKGVGDKIGPNSILMFDVKLIDVLF
jgi:FKBP-type peptidyl-prolyl cis-trans isomerase FkpA